MKLRVISAIIAISLVIIVAVFLKSTGLLVFSALVALGVMREYARLSYVRLEAPTHLRLAFLGLASAVALAAALSDAVIVVGTMAMASVFLVTMSLMTVRRTEDLPVVLELQGLGVIGLFYCGLFPGLAARLLQVDSSGLWFFALMAIVFSGDTFAYLAGRLFGKTKLLEAVSPKKTIEGAIGGLVGSALAGALTGLFFIPELPLFAIVLTALVTGAFAQIGDLFESLLKRVAAVKDSGGMMPGHGGLLDRVDGLLFAAPVFYVLVRILISDS